MEPRGKGAYILVLELEGDQTIPVGKLGDLRFKKGIYLYVGSAMGGFRSRVGRYLSGIRTKRWHIDYLLSRSKIRAVLLIPSELRLESYLAERLSRVFEEVHPGFGSSDTRDRTHLFYVG
ncbi:MAG: GIY-YIG nuclease family protein [Candidatus Hydrothermae bacterium]|nr:GIY-YIG nuclease family protein [Candidatus Hydrothermae bacterium]